MKTGIERLCEDLQEMGFTVEKVKDTNRQDYAVIKSFDIPAGTLVNKIVNLAIPALPDYPRSFPASIHVDQELFPRGQVPGKRNIINSSLGAQWHYWSYRFVARSANPTSELITQINEIFRKN
jgi:E2/UBC family protein E